MYECRKEMVLEKLSDKTNHHDYCIFMFGRFSSSISYHANIWMMTNSKHKVFLSNHPNNMIVFKTITLGKQGGDEALLPSFPSPP